MPPTKRHSGRKPGRAFEGDILGGHVRGVVQIIGPQRLYVHGTWESAGKAVKIPFAFAGRLGANVNLSELLPGLPANVTEALAALLKPLLSRGS